MDVGGHISAVMDNVRDTLVKGNLFYNLLDSHTCGNCIILVVYQVFTEGVVQKLVHEEQPTHREAVPVMGTLVDEVVVLHLYGSNE